MSTADLDTDQLQQWYRAVARDLPWRRPGTSPWAVLVSEFMLQQTPVARVLEPYATWLTRWPTPAALAAEPSGEAVRAWGRLGYPRRALRLHAAAVHCVTHHDGAVPATVPELLALPGVGEYTARAVAAFAFRQRHAVVDTNVRRVVVRALLGAEDAATVPREVVERLLPSEDEQAAQVSTALMELGAVVCRARAPQCGSCPWQHGCSWRRAGRPRLDQPVRRAQAYAGTDRQVRGLLLAVLRGSDAPDGVPRMVLDAVWPDAVQRERALAGLVTDGLAVPLQGDRFSLPGQVQEPRR